MSSQNNTQGQPASGQQRLYPNLLRAEDIQRFPMFDDEARRKYADAFRQTWDRVEKSSPDSPEHQQAIARLTEWSQKLRSSSQSLVRAKAAQQQGGQQRPTAAGLSEEQQAKQQQLQTQQKQQLQSHPQQQHQPGVKPANVPAQTQVSQAVMTHVQSYPFVLPPQIRPGTLEAERKLKELKQTYAMALARQENASNNIKKLNSIIEQRKSQGQDVATEIINQRSSAEQSYNGNKALIDEFKNKQNQWRQQQKQIQSQQPQQAQPNQQIAHNNPQVKFESGGSGSGGLMTQTLPSQTSIHQHSHVNPNADASRQQVNSRPTPGSSSSTQISTQNQQQVQGQAVTSVPGSTPNQLPSQTNMANQARPQFQQQQQQQQPGQVNQHNSPHSQAGNPNGPPVPLSHQAAMSAAARSYSDRQTQQQASQSAQGYGTGNREHTGTSNPKMPIPSKLNVQPPQPVSMGPARPTLGGPSTGAPGMMGQPVLPKYSPYVLEGDADRVLSKRKLDELVRQVTGAGEGTGGEALTSEVEEAMLQLADEFVDNVISAACKLAKLRESPQLDIRDIQLVLERNYNIRIPGYASDEIRTVRKLHPAPGWTQKMNAVQAAKVMGGKADI